MATKESVVNSVLDDDIVISDEEIQALATLSHRTNATIVEDKKNGKYIMSIKYDKDDEQVIMAYNRYDDYKDMSNTFFKKFIKFGGNISMSDVFMDE